MLLIIHVLIALASICLATWLYFAPSKAKMNTHYAMMALVLGSGTALLWTTKTHVLQGCMMGIAYLAGATAAIILASRKLAAEKTKI